MEPAQGTQTSTAAEHKLYLKAVRFAMDISWVIKRYLPFISEERSRNMLEIISSLLGGRKKAESFIDFDR